MKSRGITTSNSNHRGNCNRQSAFRRQRSFTLIELAAVILVMALLAGAAVLTLAHTTSQRRLEDVCDQFMRADALARSAARQANTSEQLIYDLDQQMVLWQNTPEQKPIVLAHWDAKDELEARMGKQTFSSGQVTIEYSADGFSPNYALSVSRPDQPTRYVVVAGITGRCLCTEDNKRVDAIFQSLASDKPLAERRPNEDAGSTSSSDDAH